MNIICGNCQKIIHGEDELKCVFPDIPDLLQRISPGEPVPLGECPNCGALVHASPVLAELCCSICGNRVPESSLREHLALHHPNAEQLDWEEVRNQFRLEGSSHDYQTGGMKENAMKVTRLLDVINSADVIVVADSPYLHSVETDIPAGDPENEVLRANWHDAEGLEFEVKFTEVGMFQARIEGHTVIAADHEGEQTKIELFRLAPMQLRTFAGGIGPRRRVVINVSGGVATAEAWPADVEIEIRDYDTEGCDPQDLEPDGCRISRYGTRLPKRTDPR